MKTTNAQINAAHTADTAARSNLTASADRNMTPVTIASGRVVGFGHEVRNFGRSAVILGSSPCGDLVVQEVRGSDLVPGNVWIASAAMCN